MEVMEGLSMVTQEGHPTASTTPPTKMTFSVQTAGTDTDGDGRKPLSSTCVDSLTQENEICGKKWFCQTTETKQCSSLNQNTSNSYSLPAGQVCASQDNDVKMGSTPDLLKPTQEYINKIGTSVIKKEFKSQCKCEVESKSELDLNGCYHFRCPSPEDTSFASDVQTVDTAVPSKDATTSKEPCTSPSPPLVPSPESSITAPKPRSVPSPSNGGSERPRIIKHKPSSITFADYDCTIGLNQGVPESSDCGESSSEEEDDDDDDDVFTEMTQIREILPCYRHRRTGRRIGTGKGRGEERNGELDSGSSTGYEAEEENSSKESTTAWGSEGNQTLNNNRIARGPSWKECHGQDIFLPNSSSVTRARPRKTEMSAKRKHGGAEIEAKEACEWLRAAGFPQYAQLFEDSQFPIDITPVKKDHDFLDKDLVEPLCRRLNTLNKCASMKLDVNLPKKKSEDSDSDDLFAISDKWTFEWSSRRWSRLLDEAGPREPGEESVLRATPSSESVLTDLSEPDVSSLHSESSSGSAGVRAHSADDSDSSRRACSDSSAMPKLGTGHHSSDHPSYSSLPVKHGKPGRTRAKDFLRHMETLRSREGAENGCRTLVISAPILQHEPQALKALQCVEINGHGVLSSHSSSEGSSSQSGGSTVSTPSLKERKAHRAEHKRSGMYLDDLDVFSGIVQGKRNEFRSYEDLVVHIPKDHKPGTFPKALSIESLSPTAVPLTRVAEAQRQPSIKEQRPVTQCCSRGSRISIYDNVPGSHLYASTGDLIDLKNEDLFPHLDDILQHVNGLQQIVDHWSKNVLPTGESVEKVKLEQDGKGQENIQSSSHITLDLEGHSVLEGQVTPSDGDRDGVSLNETESTGIRERRDSGVGASLTRPNRLRWPSFQISNRLSHSVASLQITNQSAGQLSLLQRFSLLRLTAIMEKYSLSNKHGWTWSVPKFMKRMKVPDYKDKNVFGVPLIVHVQRFGQPLPLGLQQALRYLRSQCLDQVGLFRKSGVKSRIQALRQMNENSPEDVNYEDQSAYDVADMVKQFFRDLPEPLLTSKLGETFLHIYQYVPKDQRLQAVQAAIMLMSDENREVLQTLLCFLSDVTSSVQENQMTPMNIAVCLAPSLFHLNILKKENLSPRTMQKKYATGRPDQKDLNENLAATQGLAHMITECNRLFEIPHEMVTQSRNSYVEADLQAPTLEDLCKQQQQHNEEEEDEGSWPVHLESRLQVLLKEARDKAKGWVSCQSSDNTELAYKKVGDGNPLRRWRVSVEVEAPPSVVLNRILRERHLWDVDLLQWRLCEVLDKQTEIFQYVLNRMPPHPSRDFVVLRSWRTNLARGACSLVSVSIEHDECSLIGGVRGVVLESGYLLEPCGSGKSRLTHICRVDLKGRTPEWYNKAFGHLCAAEAARIRNSFQPIHSDGPETKI
ncbi:stAR-related lipid transfer protein 13 isoform X2 [Hemibagrus wyckioides]|uniref:stAR-related lipid transfer protein 13 isoform X2 n=1 Tax=Hemibagrus wyckioides TaxID=337641 RepID=UPI00266BC80C|nr:stAR-related lipid transfer protein 13 isoform X2 [Hemibagrus wyckioides]